MRPLRLSWRLAEGADIASLRASITADLRQAGLAALHSLGQHFMIDAAALTCLADTLGAQPGMRVVEIGPGTGVLTTVLLERGCQVLAVELDRGMVGLLEGKFGQTAVAESRGRGVAGSTSLQTSSSELGPAHTDDDLGSMTGSVTDPATPRPRDPATAVPAFSLIHGDCLAAKTRLHPAIEDFAAAGPWTLGANLPYDVSIPVILNAAALPRPPAVVAVTVQLEAARRLCSRPGEAAWGASAAVLQASGIPRLVRRLPPGCFMPPPRVDSAILAWTPTSTLPAGFGAWCRKVFSFRRKVLPGALRDAGLTRMDAEAACQACGLDLTRRLQDLDAPELLALFALLPPTA